MRSFSMPKIGLSRKPDDAMAGSPYQFESSHSRESSGASTASTPLTPTFSNRSHGLWQNSNSSFGTTPESPVNLTKSPLHDLPEDPEEREDGSFDIPRHRQDSDYQNDDDPLCICMLRQLFRFDVAALTLDFQATLPSAYTSLDTGRAQVSCHPIPSGYLVIISTSQHNTLSTYPQMSVAVIHWLRV